MKHFPIYHQAGCIEFGREKWTVPRVSGVGQLEVSRLPYLEKADK
jgi:hypothetical protein